LRNRLRKWAFVRLRVEQQWLGLGCKIVGFAAYCRNCNACE
jgi:hypothetical protein